jgi:type IV pilus assembly protein PilB
MSVKHLGQILVKRGVITREQLEMALSEQKKNKKYLGQILIEMGISAHEINDGLDLYNKRRTIGQILIDSRNITSRQLKDALMWQRTTHAPLATTLLSMGYISQQCYLETLSKHFNMPIISLKEHALSLSLQKVLGRKFTLKNKIIVLESTPEVIKIALSEPSRLFLDELQSYKPVSKNMEFYLAVPSELENALEKIYNEDDYADNGEKLVISQSSFNKTQTKSVYTEDIQTKRASQLLDNILESAINKHASDVHIEAREFGGLVKLRIDGVLHLLKMPDDFNKEYKPIISIIKVLTESMRLDEKVVPQDGSFRVHYGLTEHKKTIDFRVSSINTNYGESITLRLLDQDNAKVTLPELGFSKEIYEKFSSLIKRPEGMILVAGPTGSGKTTTLYASLNAVLDPRKKILSIEDPIEYIYDDIVIQSEVNRARHVDYSTLLKAFLRQDPDIIMVGEIRDSETANTSIKAVQTGHLLLSTLHTIDTTQSIGRIRELDIDPVTFLSYTTGVLGQRLVRKICAHCCEEYDPDPEMVSHYFGTMPDDVPFVRGRGCSMCNYEGYVGRTVLAELWIITDEELSKINTIGNAFEVRMNALANGLSTFYMDGIRKLQARETTLDQLLKTVPNIEKERDMHKARMYRETVNVMERSELCAVSY